MYLLDKVIEWGLLGQRSSGKKAAKPHSASRVKKLEHVVKQQKKQIRELKAELRKKEEDNKWWDRVKEKASVPSEAPLPDCFANTEGVKCPACGDTTLPCKVVEHYSTCTMRREGVAR